MTDITGIITKGVGGLYEVRDTSDSSILYTCRARGKFRSEGITPLPGDTVVLAEESGDRVIDSIMPRRSALIRPAMANLSHMFVLIPTVMPRPDLLMADKLTAIAEGAGVEPVIVIGKSDLDREYADELMGMYKAAGFDTFCISSVSGDGVDTLREYIYSLQDDERPIITAFAGVSGAGKSTLMNALFPSLSLQSGAVSVKTARGKHTTREATLFPINIEDRTVYIADTPGFSMLDFTRFNFFPSAELADNFRDFSDCIGMCKYTKCTHTKEEGCAVLEKLRQGKLSLSRHENYIKIFAELKATPEWKRKKFE